MSDWFLTDEHLRLREQVREFADAEVAPRVALMETSADVDTETVQQIARRGLIGVNIPRTHGGMGAGHLAKVLIVEELSRVSGAMGAAAQASQLGVAKILTYGSQEQKRRWLPKIAEGSCLPTIAVTEEGSGGHVLGMQATARRDGDHWILNGHKVHVGNSQIGGLHGVVVRTGDADTRRSKSLSAFLVESDRPGVTAVPYRPAMGLRGFGFGELILDEVRVPAANMVGDQGQGLDVAYSSSVLFGRLNLAAVALGILQAILDQTVQFAATRHRYGKPLADLPPIQQKIGEIQHLVMTVRLAVYHAARLLDHGAPCDEFLFNAKYLSAQAAMDAARTAMEIHAAAGLQTDRGVERMFRDAAHIYSPAGTGEIQLLRLAQHALGVDHGQWSQRLAHVTALSHPLPTASPHTQHRPPAPEPITNIA